MIRFKKENLPSYYGNLFVDFEYEARSYELKTIGYPAPMDIETRVRFRCAMYLRGTPWEED